MSELARLVVPAIRWHPERGFAAARARIDDALCAGVGGFIVRGGARAAVEELTAELHERSLHPLLIATEPERGASARADGTIGLPPLAALGSLGEVDAVRRAARVMAREARRLGANWAFAPVCDLALPESAPVVRARAFGGDPSLVAELAAEWIDACQAAGVLACATHFPGHGHVRVDARAESLVIEATDDEIYGEDLVPFRAAIDAGVASIVATPATCPTLDPSGAPVALSRPIVHHLLRDRLGFDGLVAARLTGVRSDEAHAAVRALAAGGDLILEPANIAATVAAIAAALEDHVLDPEEIRRSLSRRARWAEWCALRAGVHESEDDDRRWSEELAERVIQVLCGTVRPLARAVDVIVVGSGSPEHAPSARAFISALHELGHDAREAARPTTSSRGPVLVAFIGGESVCTSDALSALRAACREAERAARDAIVVHFGHPSLAPALPEATAVACAWGDHIAMQEATARWLARGG